jgi:eukaryotic-like serine/threonine-protein kinase
MSSLRPEEVIVDAALAKPRGERAAFLEQACGGNTELHQLAEALLSAHYLAAAANPTATRIPPTPAVQPFSAASDKPGDRIAEYKILQQIGEGGCGVVYMAEQEEPVRRRVALKVIKPGMDSKQVIARFEAERQALAMMDHVNIAKVLDAGTTDAGRPYFVMELVRGIRITEYCDQNNLSTAQRLALFLLVCKAIQHAHQKGIIHRDIKPSNILVTLHDGVPVPKVIDFGIAKAIEQRLTDKTVFTALNQFIGTPAYMSPEQAEMSGLDIDTRSDIYSLGVLLYELLTGKPPFEAKDLAGAGLDEMRRIIRERDPILPSSRISTLEAAEQTTVARCRQVEAPKLIHLVRGDLDWIVMKCLEKDRSRRYETTNGLAMDIRRHLANEPVVARPASVAYRFRKMVRRNKVAVAAVSAVVAALLIGLCLAAWQFIDKSKAYERVRIEADKSKQVARFLKDTLKSAGPSVANGRDISILKEILDRTSERVGRELTNQPEAQMEIRRILSQTYQDLDLLKQSETVAREALALGRNSLGESHPETPGAMHQLGIVLMLEGNLDESEALLRKALALDERAGRTNEAAISLNSLGSVLRMKGNLEEAESVERNSLAMMKALWGPNDFRIAEGLPNLAEVLMKRGNFREAESTLREALAIEQQRGTNTFDEAKTLVSLANALSYQSKLEESLAASRTALEIFKRVAPDQPDLIVLTLMSIAGALLNQKHPEQAEPLIREAIELKMKQSTNATPDLAMLQGNLAVTLSSNPAKLEEAESLTREVLATQKRLLSEEHPDVALTLNNLATILTDRGKLDEAEQTFKQALDMKRKLVGNRDPDVHSILNNLGEVLRRQGKLAEAEGRHRESLTLCREQLPKDHPSLLGTMEGLAQALMLEGADKLPEAESLCREALGLRERKTPDGWTTFNTRNLLGGCLAGLKKFEDAEPLLIGGYEGMKQREAKIPFQVTNRLTEAGVRVIGLYVAWGKLDKAEEWRVKLAASAAKTSGNSADPLPAKK